MTVKDLVVSAMNKLPENASFEDAMDKLLFLNKIEQGLDDVSNGRVLTTDQVKQKLGL